MFGVSVITCGISGANGVSHLISMRFTLGALAGGSLSVLVQTNRPPLSSGRFGRPNSLVHPGEREPNSDYSFGTRNAITHKGPNREGGGKSGGQILATDSELGNAVTNLHNTEGNQTQALFRVFSNKVLWRQRPPKKLKIENFSCGTARS